MATERQPPQALALKITAHFREFCADHALQVLTTATDKYGSLVWEAGCEVAGLARYLILAITLDVPSEDERPAEVIEVWTAADDGQRYARRRIAERHLPEARAKVGGLTTKLLRRRWERARELREQALSESYLVPRA
jgi:hypothetical protein